jgi:hypothetical protein
VVRVGDPLERRELRERREELTDEFISGCGQARGRIPALSTSGWVVVACTPDEDDEQNSRKVAERGANGREDGHDVGE